MKINYQEHLPVSSYRKEVVSALQSNQILIISGDTGSGKTTQIPKMCLEFLSGKKGKIGCTQPRRIAAQSVSHRVAEELGKFGNIVGYKIRFSDHTDTNTQIKFMTDGVLLSETRSDKLLKQYDILIIDEAHERSLNIDFLLGYLKQILPKRPDLKIIITSATIDTEKFASHFDNAPIIEIPGKLYPVELRYRPPGTDDSMDTESYLDLCVKEVRDIVMYEPPGDILVFLPTENDIRICCDLLDKMTEYSEILPLFGKLNSIEQKKIFKSYKKQKIVVATNIAETSITVPGIRYVVDTGLARISVYNPRARTKSLPIKKVSQASCNQRKGRCGRIGPGVCVRLYSEEDFQQREEYSLPEIKRSNLADVILQMISFRLGDPYSFPFIDPPHSSAIRDGFRLLYELGGLDEKRKLTPFGKQMAHLPIDPCIARIILEAKKNKCLDEVIVIASCLAIQDPRVRPADSEKKADSKHKAFIHEHSDFLTLLNIWNTYFDVKSKTSWSQLKKFCIANYLSFQRMREWIDLHGQMRKILKLPKLKEKHDFDSPYDNIHKSLAIGFLRNIGVKKKGRIYNSTLGKELMIFPGSGQFEKNPQWILGASFLETNRLYGLTIASINQDWLESLAPFLCKYSWSDPHYNKRSGQVVANERVSLFGLTIVEGRKINFGKTNATNQSLAREIFIQSALVEGNLQGSYPFLHKNQALIRKWEQIENRIRSKDILVQDQDIAQFYDSRLHADIYDRASLNKYLKKCKDQSHLFMKEEDVIDRKLGKNELIDYPTTLNYGPYKFKLKYSFDPTDKKDGVTAVIPLNLFDSIKGDVFEWLVPGLLREKILFLLKSLPKRLRRQLIPLNIAVDRIYDDLPSPQSSPSFYHCLERSVGKLYGVTIARSDWPDELPQYLKMRFSFVDIQDKEITATRKFELDKKDQETPELSIDHITEKKTLDLLKKWDSFSTRSWDFTDLPQRIPIYTGSKKITGYLYPALTPDPVKSEVVLSFIQNKNEAITLNRKGVQFLYRLQFSSQFKQLKKHCGTALSGPSALWLIELFKGKAQAIESLLFFILESVFKTTTGVIPSKAEFDKKIQEVTKNNFYRQSTEIFDKVMALLRTRMDVVQTMEKYRQLDQASRSLQTERFTEYQNLLNEILPSEFLKIIQYNEIEDRIRYLKSLSIRIERAHTDYRKDSEKAKIVSRYSDHCKKLYNDERYKESDLEKISLFCMMVQELRISVFSPELGTNISVSPKKLEKLYQEITGKKI